MTDIITPNQEKLLVDVFADMKRNQIEQEHGLKLKLSKGTLMKKENGILKAAIKRTNEIIGFADELERVRNKVSKKTNGKR